MSEIKSNSVSDTIGQMTFIWNIYNLDMYPSSYRKPIKSANFGLHPSGKPKYHFELHPRGKSEDEKDTNIYLYLIEFKDKETLKKIKYKCSASVSKLSPGAHVHDCESARFKPSKRTNEFVIPNHMFPEGDVSLRFEISYDKDISTKSEWTCIDENLDELSSAISKVYNDQLHWDTVLYSKDIPFLIHRAILDVRFPKLAKEINKTTNTVSISSNIKTDVTEHLLRYMYSGKLNEKNIPANIYDAMATAIYELTESKSMILGEPRSIFTSTSFQKFHFSLVWRIQNFSELRSSENRSYSFQENTPSWTWTKISLCFSEETENGDDDIVFSIERYSCICKTILCRIKVSDLDKTFKHSFDGKNLWRMPVFIKKNELLENKSKYLSDDVLNIDLEIFVSDGTCESKIDRIDFLPHLKNQTPQPNTDLKLFRDDLQILVNNPKFSDITIVTGEENFHAHKFMLSARSAVFCTMLKANKNDQISIVDMDAAVMKSVLKFIYCGEVENAITDIKYTIGLYTAANKYEISSLQRKCVQFLKKELSSKNAVDILMAAYACCDRDLKQHVNDFICSNPQLIINSRAWENIKGKKDLVLGLLERALTLVANKKVKNFTGIFKVTTKP